MDQSSALAASTGTRRSLRALLLLGGFVVVWFLLATGTAQASDGPGRGHGSDRPHRDVSVKKALGATVDHVVEGTADHARRTVEHVTKRPEPRPETAAPAPAATPAKTPAKTPATTPAPAPKTPVTAPVESPVEAPAEAPVKAPVKASVQESLASVTSVGAHLVETVQTAPATELLATTTETLLTAVDGTVHNTIRATVAPVLEQAHGVLVQVTAGTPLVPVLEASPTSPTPLPLLGSTTAVVSETVEAGAPARHATRAQSASSAASTSLSAASGVAVSTTDRSGSNAPVQVLPVSPIDRVPGGHAPGAADDAAVYSGQSGSASGAPVGLLTTAFGLVPPVAQGLVPTHADRFPAGPTYRPSSSPG